MPSIAQLNVEIGARIGGLQKGIRDAERELRSGGKRLANVANELSQTFSIALGGLIAGSITAAGEIESLRLAMQSTFESAGRSIEQANAHMEDLRKAALAPGLDFPQAVKASIRLQGVGANAEDALKTIRQLANAISLTGGTAANLESVTVQMAQMISKGKVLAQDLRIIQENMPIVSRLMQEAFGTSNSEALQELGITGAEFVAKITAEMEKLPRVSGGITNAIVNFWSALKQAAAEFGEEINRVFNIGQKAEQFSSYLSEIVTWFKSLDDSTKKLIVSTTLYVAAAGPVIKILGSIRLAGAQVVSTFGSIVSVSKNAIGGFLNLAQSLGSIRTALALIGGGAALAAVTAIAGAVFLFSQNTNAAAVAAKEFNKAQSETTRLYAQQTAELNKNFDTLRNVNATTSERKAAIDSLKAAYPDYLKSINLEIASNETLTAIQKKLGDEILRSVAERQKAIAVTAIYEKQAQLLLRIQQLRDGARVTPGEATQVDTGDLIRTGSVAAAVIEEMQKQADGLKIEARRVGDEFDKTFNIVAAPRRFTPIHDLKTGVTETNVEVKDLTTNLDKHTKKVKEVEYQYQNTLLYVKQMADSMLAASDAAKLFNFLQPITPLSGRPLYDEKKPLTSQNAGAPGIAESVAIIQAKISPLKQFFDTFWDGFQRDTQLTADGIVSAGSQIENTMASLTEKGAGSMEALGKATLVYAMDAFRANMLAGLAEVLRGALSSVPFPFNLAIAGAAVAGASALFKGLQNKIVSPKLAQGGIAYGPTSAIVGEYPGARANPEVIAPLSKLKAIIGAGRAENQRVTVGGAVRWSGTEFVIGFEQAQKQLRRTRGY